MKKINYVVTFLKISSVYSSGIYSIRYGSLQVIGHSALCIPCVFKRIKENSLE